MRRGWRTLEAFLRLLVVSALLPSGYAVALTTQESNFRPYLVGERAAGMGGAFTALADDGSGPYYNPGGLAFVGHSMLSLSGSVYGMVRGVLKDGLGTGHDFIYSDPNISPVSTSAIMKFGADQSSANALAFSVFIPDALTLDDHSSLDTSGNYVLYTLRQQTVWVGPTYSRRFDRLGIGASAFALVGTETMFIDYRQGTETAFTTTTGRRDMTMVGVVGAIGLRYDISDSLRLGLAYYSPEIGLYGTRRVFSRIETPASSQQVVLDGLQATPSLPWRASAGFAWTSGTLTLSADVIVLGAREVHDDPNFADRGADRWVKRNMVVNGAAGIEYVVADSFPLRAGVFTDFASSPSPPNPAYVDTAHVDRYGGSVSIGYSTAHTSSDLGLNVSLGSGQDFGTNQLGTTATANTKLSSLSQVLCYLFLGTSYRF